MAILEADGEKIHRLVSNLFEYKFAHNKLRGKLLESLLEVVDIKGPCTIIKMTRLFSEFEEGYKFGKMVDFIHLNAPYSQQLLDEWEEHIRSADSLIEKQLYRKFKFQQWGVARIKELFKPQDLLNWNIFRHTRIYYLAKKAKLGDMLFAGIRCSSPNELWAICLRRLDSEPPFSNYEYQLVRYFIKLLVDFRSAWDIEKNQYSLTEREREVIYHYVCGLSDKEISQTMNIAKSTVNKHWENIFSKVLIHSEDGKNMKIKVLKQLGMISI